MATKDYSIVKYKRHGLRKHALSDVWRGMIRRCVNPKHNSFHRYGGRGVSVCQEWRESFIAFYEWAQANGYSKGLQLDRADNDGNYEPSNCRFVSSAANIQNSTSARLKAEDIPVIRSLHAGGWSQCMLAKAFGVWQPTIRDVVTFKSWKDA